MARFAAAREMGARGRAAQVPARRRADTQKLDRPFAIRSDAGLELALAEVALATDVDHKLDCPVQ